MPLPTPLIQNTKLPNSSYKKRLNLPKKGKRLEAKTGQEYNPPKPKQMGRWIEPRITNLIPALIIS